MAKNNKVKLKELDWWSEKEKHIKKHYTDYVREVILIDLFNECKARRDKEMRECPCPDYQKGLKDGEVIGREGVIKKIEDKFADQYGRIKIRIDSKEWESLKHGD
jgi:hypothetical protein